MTEARPDEVNPVQIAESKRGASIALVLVGAFALVLIGLKILDRDALLLYEVQQISGTWRLVGGDEELRDRNMVAPGVLEITQDSGDPLAPSDPSEGVIKYDNKATPFRLVRPCILRSIGDRSAWPFYELTGQTDVSVSLSVVTSVPSLDRLCIELGSGSVNAGSRLTYSRVGAP